MNRWDAHTLVLWWWWGWAVWSTSWSRVVLGASPRETDTRVADRVALHLVDGHLSSVTLDELDETAAFSWWDLDIGDLSEALEEAAKLILGDVSRESSNKHGSVVRIGKLVHRLWGAIVTDSWSTLHGEHAWCHVAAHSTTWHSTHAASTWPTASGFVLWSSSRDAHWAVTAVNTLHLSESALLIALIREANESVTARHARDWVGHDLSRLARWEAALEERHENVLVDLRSEISDEDREFWSAVIATISETTTGSPVELEWARGVWDHLTVQSESLGSGLRGREINETISSVAGELVTNHLDVDLLAHAEPDGADEVLVDPWLKLTHPILYVNTHVANLAPQGATII